MPCPPLSRLPRWGTCGTARPTQEAAPRRRIASTAQPGVAQVVRLPAQAPLCGAGSDAAARTKIAPLYRSILYKPLQLRPGRHAPPRPRVALRWTRCPGGGVWTSISNVAGPSGLAPPSLRVLDRPSCRRYQDEGSLEGRSHRDYPAQPPIVVVLRQCADRSSRVDLRAGRWACL